MACNAVRNEFQNTLTTGTPMRSGSFSTIGTPFAPVQNDPWNHWGGALQSGPGGPWRTQNFGWVGHNAFGPPNIWPACSSA